MKVVVALEHRFLRTPDGAVWTSTFFAHSFWRRYLSAFDGVSVLARTQAVPSAARGWKRVDGDGVSVVPVPAYVGPWQYLRQTYSVRRAVRRAVAAEDAVILRVSSQIAACLTPLLRRTGHPYGVEVVADPYDALAPGALQHPLRPLFRWWFPRLLRRQCAAACGAAYVTEFALQRRYPSHAGAFATHYSSVELGDEAFVEHPRASLPAGRLVTVATLEELYKGPDVLIDAFARCVGSGLDLHLIIVGQGRREPDLRSQADRVGLGDRVRFTGALPSGAAVRRELDAAGLFVLPSRQDGLPRAMIEAMARALPCIGSSVGGIPELLPPEDTVPPDDATALAEKIREVANDSARLHQMSQRNLTKAREYHDTSLAPRRTRFYAYVRQATEVWLRSRTGLIPARMSQTFYDDILVL